MRVITKKHGKWNYCTLIVANGVPYKILNVSHVTPESSFNGVYLKDAIFKEHDDVIKQLIKAGNNVTYYH